MTSEKKPWMLSRELGIPKPQVPVSAGIPEFIPLPPPGGVEPYSGLKRGKLNQLILPSAANNWKPPVKSISLRPPGCIKGKRLVHLKSLLDYLRKQMSAPEPGE